MDIGYKPGIRSVAFGSVNIFEKTWDPSPTSSPTFLVPVSNIHLDPTETDVDQAGLIGADHQPKLLVPFKTFIYPD